MINVFRTFRTSLQSSPLYNQPLQKFKLLDVTLKHNDCTSFSFLVYLCPWVEVKLCQNGIKLEILVSSNITLV